MWGRVGVAASAAKPGRVWAIVEAKKKGGLYRLRRLRREVDARQRRAQDPRARLVLHVGRTPDPKNADSVYLPNVELHHSTDGGKTFDGVSVLHGDNHDLWIDPDDPKRMILGDDGGATITFNGGRTWSTQNNQPTAQFYRVATDDRFPYWVYGSQQDNSNVGIPSSVPGSAHRQRRLARGRRRRERLDRAQPEGPGRRLRRRIRRPDHALRPPHAPGPRDHGVAAARGRARDERPEVPLPVERADPHLAARSEGALPRVADPAAHAATRARRGRRCRRT